MKIAILDVEPRVCGPMSWTRHLQSGFRSLGHRCDVVTSTKSGRGRNSWGEPKWGGRWSIYLPEVVVKHSDLSETLREYDLVVLPEPRVPNEDRTAIKNETTPTYVTALEDSGVKFVTALHGNDYSETDSPFATRLFSASGFVPKLIVHSQRSWDSSDLVKSMSGFIVPLPYEARVPIDADAPRTATVGTTGRFMFNKGAHLVAMAARWLTQPAETVVELWGSAATGLGTNVTYSVYEELLKNAAAYARYGDQEEKKDRPEVTEHGNTIRPYLWDVRLDSGQLVRYLGNYTDPVSVCRRLGVHVNLTGHRYSGGLVEYSTLEAMDAGSICITPNHVSDERYITQRVDLLNPPGSIKSALKSYDVVRQVGDAVNEALDVARFLDGGEHSAIIQHNREQIRAISDPALIATRILEEAA